MTYSTKQQNQKKLFHLTKLYISLVIERVVKSRLTDHLTFKVSLNNCVLVVLEVLMAAVQSTYGH